MVNESHTVSMLEQPFEEAPTEVPRPTQRRKIATAFAATFAIAAVVAVVVVFTTNGSSDASSDSTTRHIEYKSIDVPMSRSGGEPGTENDPSPPLLSVEEGPTLIRGSVNGDVDAYQEITSRFNAQFAPQLVDYLNRVGVTYPGTSEKLQVTKAVILGFPATAIPTSGHVTHDFMTTMGGLHVMESPNDPFTFGATDPEYVPQLVNTALYKQDSSADALHKLTYSQSFTSSQTMSVTEGISSTISAEISVGIPDLGLGSKLSSKMTSSMSTTASNTESRTDKWQTEEDITIPAHTVTNGTCYIAAGSLRTPFSGSVQITDASNIGWVFYDAKHHTGSDPWFWFFQTDQTGAGLKRWVNTVGSSMSMDMHVSGVYSGVAGTRVQCEVHSCPYKPDVQSCYR